MRYCMSAVVCTITTTGMGVSITELHTSLFCRCEFQCSHYGNHNNDRFVRDILQASVVKGYTLGSYSIRSLCCASASN